MATPIESRADRLAAGLDLEGALVHSAADPLGDLERLLVRCLGKEDAELLAAEPSGDVVVTELRPEHVGDPRR